MSQKAAAAIADKWQGNSGYWQKAERYADIYKNLGKNHETHAG